MRVHKIDVLVCRACGGRLRVIAFLSDAKLVRRILHHLSIAPVLLHTRARSPPTTRFASAFPVDDPFIDPPTWHAD